jgi:large subunit ribosomal protein L18e
LNRHTEQKESVVVPGKVLGAGRLEHPLVVAAFAFSDEARQKIVQAKGKCLTISELVENAPKGSNVRILE